jgi:hypothetical protein
MKVEYTPLYLSLLLLMGRRTRGWRERSFRMQMIKVFMGAWILIWNWLKRHPTSPNRVFYETYAFVLSLL